MKQTDINLLNTFPRQNANRLRCSSSNLFPAVVKDLAFQLNGEVENLFLVLGAEINGKPLLTVMISDNIVADKGLNAGQIVREAGREIKGGGGGQAFYATAGGKDVAGLQAAIEKALSFL